jgi:hypothetical protein
MANEIYQNITQMVASCEVFCRKRKHSSGDYNDVPTCGIVTSAGVDGIFLLYSFEENQWVVRGITEYYISLNEHHDIIKAQIE